MIILCVAGQSLGDDADFRCLFFFLNLSGHEPLLPVRGRVQFSCLILGPVVLRHGELRGLLCIV